ncbi:hypothetical protein ES703_87521 [subsurface metagenome]
MSFNSPRWSLLTDILQVWANKVRGIGFQPEERLIDYPQLVDNDIAHGQDNRHIRAGYNWHPLRCLTSGEVADWVEDNHFHASSPGVGRHPGGYHSRVAGAMTLARSEIYRVVTVLEVRHY